MEKKMLGMLLLSISLLVMGCGSEKAAQGEQLELSVSAAASMTDAMKEVGMLYEEEHPQVHVVYNFGSSGALQQAIENGGTADIFVSAAQKQMDVLEEKGMLAAGKRVDLLKNDIVLIEAVDSQLMLADFGSVLDPAVQHIALGEPKGVPVGQYSEEIFRALGILDQVKARAVYGSDVRQVLAWVETGNADCGVVYATDAALSDKVRVVTAAPADTHRPIIYPAAVLKDAPHAEEAAAFLTFLQSDKAQAVFVKYGFQAP